jgi:hypothetical protein
LKAVFTEEELMVGAELPDIHVFPEINTWTKIRPGVREVLEVLSHHYVLHIFSMGQRVYVKTIAKLLDPEGRLFSNRVLSSCDVVNPFKLLTDTGMKPDTCVILDDTPEVWPHDRQRLFKVERYIYFPVEVGDLSSFGTGGDECYDTGSLKAITRVLQHVADGVMRCGSEKTLKLQRSNVLKGKIVNVSRLIAPDQSAANLVELSLAMGAKRSCVGLTADCTHFVCSQITDQDARLARSKGVKVVNSNWLYLCNFTITLI